KLDCACEKKIFDIIDKIDKSRKSYNKIIKKKIHLKYGFGFVTTCLVPLLGIILPVLDMIDSNIMVNSSQSSQGYKTILNASGIPMEFSYIYIAFFLILSYIILAIINYIMVKIMYSVNSNKIKIYESIKFLYDFSKYHFVLGEIVEKILHLSLKFI
ncbi:variable surface protein, partial [Plasmodium gonderi]